MPSLASLSLRSFPPAIPLSLRPLSRVSLSRNQIGPDLGQKQIAINGKGRLRLSQCTGCARVVKHSVSADCEQTDDSALSDW